MKVIIDRFEGDIAVVETPDGETVNMPRKLLPDAKEGDVIDISIDDKETKARRERIEKLRDALFED